MAINNWDWGNTMGSPVNIMGVNDSPYYDTSGGTSSILDKMKADTLLSNNDFMGTIGNSITPTQDTNFLSGLNDWLGNNRDLVSGLGSLGKLGAGAFDAWGRHQANKIGRDNLNFQKDAWTRQYGDMRQDRQDRLDALAASR